MVENITMVYFFKLSNVFFFIVLVFMPMCKFHKKIIDIKCRC